MQCLPSLHLTWIDPLVPTQSWSPSMRILPLLPLSHFLTLFLSPYGIIIDSCRSLFHFLLASQRSCFESLFNMPIASSSFPRPCVIYHWAHVRATPSTAEQFHLFILNLSLSLCQNALYIGHRNGSLLTWYSPSFWYHMNLLLGFSLLPRSWEQIRQGLSEYVSWELPVAGNLLFAPTFSPSLHQSNCFSYNDLDIRPARSHSRL